MNQQMDNDQLIQRLKEAALADLPRFSPALHEKIMRGLESAKVEAVRLRIRGRLRHVAAALIVCTTGAVFAVFYIKNHPRTSIDRINTQAMVPPVPEIANPVAALDQTVATNWPANRYGSLDQDGERFLNFMARQLDVAPPSRR